MNLAKAIAMLDEMLDEFGFNMYVSVIAEMMNNLYGPSNALKTLANGNTDYPEDAIALFKLFKADEV